MSSSEKKAPTTESGDASQAREEKSKPALEAQKFEKVQEAEEEEKVLSEIETAIKKEEIDETEAVTELKEQEREEEYPLVVDTTPITEEGM
uniref:Uncharacterized protein n=1 Tax=Acrobeloides nanus TaxID=290746 RepID=A0A914D124_9BILA